MIAEGKQPPFKANSQDQKHSDQRPTTAPRPVAVLSQVAAGCRRDQNTEVEHGSTSATSDWVVGPVSIEMWSMIFAGTTCSPCHVDPSSGLHSHFAFYFFIFLNFSIH